MSYFYRIMVIVFLLVSDDCKAMDTKDSQFVKNASFSTIQEFMEPYLKNIQGKSQHEIESDRRILGCLDGQKRILTFVHDDQVRKFISDFQSEMTIEERRELDATLCDQDEKIDYRIEEIRVGLQEKKNRDRINQFVFDNAKLAIVHCIVQEQRLRQYQSYQSFYPIGLPNILEEDGKSKS